MDPPEAAMIAESEPAQRILTLLKAARRAGSGWQARCPSHDDRNPSLSITEGRDGRVLLKCHAGCTTEAIVEALGLTMADLFPRNGHASPSFQLRDLVGKIDYQYIGTGGKLLAVHRRRDYSDGSKDFWWFTVEGYKAGKPGLNGTPEKDLPLYRLPEVHSAPTDEPVLFCEGEKAVDAACAQGFTATSLCGGASQKDFGKALQALEGRTVYLWPDYDQQGVSLMGRIGDALTGKAKSLYWLQPTDLSAWKAQPKDDAADYFIRDGNTAEALRECLAKAPTYERAAPEASNTHILQGAGRPVGDEWPEPPGDAAIAGLAGAVVSAIDPHTEADRVAVLVNFLIAFGCALGDGPHMMVGATRHSARIFVALVGKTSRGRKGESWSPVRALFERADPEWAARGIANGMSSGEGLIWGVRDPIEKTEARKQKGQPTTYETVLADEGVQDKRLLVVEPELARVLQTMNRQGNTLSPVIRLAWDTGTLQIMTKSAPAKATGAHISIVGHITVEELRAELSDLSAANGFANRFIWIAVRRSKSLPNPTAFEGTAVDELAGRIAERLALARGVGCMERDAEANQLWVLVYKGLTAEEEGLVAGILGRSEAQVMRLSMLYALLDGSQTIRVSHLQSALELWGYSERCARYIFGDVTGDPVADAIHQAIKQRGRMTRTDISSLFGRNVSAARLSHAFRLLLDKGRARMFTEETGGRPVEVWEAARPTA